MPPRAKTRAKQAAANDSDDELNGTSNKAMNKAGVKRKAAPKAREPLKDRTNETAEEDEKPKPKRAKTGRKAKIAAVADEQIANEPPTQNPPTVPEVIIPETQPEVAETLIDDLPAREAVPPRAASLQPLPIRPSARSQVYIPRARSASVSEHINNRHRLPHTSTSSEYHALQQAYTSLLARHESLLSLGVHEASQNFSKLQTLSESKTRASNELITQLKKEVASLRATLASQTGELSASQARVKELEAGRKALVEERDGLKEKVARAMLPSAGGGSAVGASAGVGGGALPTVGAGSVGTSASVSNMETAKKKLNLYSDLTGLVITSIKTKDGEDVYDCIQTGRNGTLHFHLSLGTIPEPTPKRPHGKPNTPGKVANAKVEDLVEFGYTPFLDPQRDAELIEILPEFLTEEIYFPQEKAVAFYRKLNVLVTGPVEVARD
ncbi:hypothetical protein K470DRAFT_254141 [Piedraia hortae CBS 480.64]|uniref:Monopolin complex subunit Csm1/Pcs1 C-terminal domain-containing protein n=1 Tax=Piedraia hortae CBS 480.64 TaxID=1314780 RepID=A0A6A7CAQ5_9PEZI|nr:hypothetical protein K470DRAFT_254141 [Piedraia hortae CBS 480.64]